MKHRMKLMYVLVFLNIVSILAALLPCFLSATPPQTYRARLIWNFFSSEAFGDNSLSIFISLVISELLAAVILLMTKREQFVLEFITAWIGWLKLALCVVLSPVFLFAFWLPELVKRLKNATRRKRERSGEPR